MERVADDSISQGSDVDFAHARAYNSDQYVAPSAHPQWTWREVYGQPTRL